MAIRFQQSEVKTHMFDHYLSSKSLTTFLIYVVDWPFKSYDSRKGNAIQKLILRTVISV